MNNFDPATALEWLKGENGELQMMALEELCMSLLMSDNVDRCFDNCPPRTFLPPIVNIFTNEAASEQLLEVAARSITYYLDVSADCSRRLVSSDGFLKCLVNRIALININDRTSKDLVEQCVKLLEFISTRELASVLNSDALTYILTLLSEYEQHLHKDTVFSALSIISRMCTKLNPDNDQMDYIVKSLSLLLHQKTSETPDKAIRCFMTLSENFYRKQIDSEILDSNGLVDYIFDRLSEMAETDTGNDPDTSKSDINNTSSLTYPPKNIHSDHLEKSTLDKTRSRNESSPNTSGSRFSMGSRARSGSNIVNMVPEIKKCLNTSLQVVIKLMFSLLRSSKRLRCKILHKEKFVDIFTMIILCQDDKVKSEVIRLCWIVNNSVFFGSDGICTSCIAKSLNIESETRILNPANLEEYFERLSVKYIEIMTFNIIRTNNLDHLMDLLEKDNNIGCTMSLSGITLFSLACAYGSCDMVKLLINDKCLNLGLRYSPLHYAVRFGRLDIVKILVDSDADTKRVSINGELPRDMIRSDAVKGKSNVVAENYREILKLLDDQVDEQMSDMDEMDFMHNGTIVFKGYTDIADNYIYRLLPVFCDMYRSSISNPHFPLLMIYEMIVFSDPILLADLDSLDSNFSSTIIEIFTSALLLDDRDSIQNVVIDSIIALIRINPLVYFNGFSQRGIGDMLSDLHDKYTGHLKSGKVNEIVKFFQPKHQSMKLTRSHSLECVDVSYLSCHSKSSQWCFVKSLMEKNMYEWGGFLNICVRNKSLYIICNLFSIDIVLSHGNVYVVKESEYILIPCITNTRHVTQCDTPTGVLKKHKLQSMKDYSNLMALKQNCGKVASKPLYSIMQANKSKKHYNDNEWVFLFSKSTYLQNGEYPKSLFLINHNYNIKLEFKPKLNGFVQYIFDQQVTHFFSQPINLSAFQNGSKMYANKSDSNLFHFYDRDRYERPTAIPGCTDKRLKSPMTYYATYDLHRNFFSRVLMQQTASFELLLQHSDKMSDILQHDVFKHVDFSKFENETQNNVGSAINENIAQHVEIMNIIKNVFKDFIVLMIDQCTPSSFEIETSKIINHVRNLFVCLIYCFKKLQEFNQVSSLLEQFNFDYNEVDGWRNNLSSYFGSIFADIEDDEFSGGSTGAVFVDRLIKYFEDVEKFETSIFEPSFVMSLQNLTRPLKFNLVRKAEEIVLLDRSDTVLKLEPLVTGEFLYNHVQSMLRKFWYDKERLTFPFLNTICNDALPILFTYEKDFDDNGILYYIGSNGGTCNYVNPSKYQIVLIKHSGNGKNSTGNVSKYLSRSKCKNNISTNEDINSWVMIDMGLWFKPTAYSLRLTGGCALRNWEFQCSVDGKIWHNLRKHTEDKSLRQNAHSMYTWILDSLKNTKLPKEFRYVRIFSTGPNSSKRSSAVAFSGFELYGSVTKPVFDLSSSAIYDYDKTVPLPLQKIISTIDETCSSSRPVDDRKEYPALSQNCIVVRGPNWRWSDQDGNGCGVVKVIYPDKWVRVRWDTGGVNTYRYGFYEKYDVVLCSDQSPAVVDSVPATSTSTATCPENTNKHNLMRKRQVDGNVRRNREDNRRKMMRSLIPSTPATHSVSTARSDVSVTSSIIDDPTLSMIADASDNYSNATAPSEYDFPRLSQVAMSSIATQPEPTSTDSHIVHVGSRSITDSMVGDSVMFVDDGASDSENSMQDLSTFPEIVSTLWRGSRFENTRSLLTTFANLVRNPNFDSSQSRHFVRLALSQSRYSNNEMVLDSRCRELAAFANDDQNGSIYYQIDNNCFSIGKGHSTVEEESNENETTLYEPDNDADDDVGDASSRDSHIWTEDSHIRRVFTALVPTFDPRPGRVIVNHINIINSNFLLNEQNFKRNTTMKKMNEESEFIPEIELYLVVPDLFDLYTNERCQVLLEKTDRPIFCQILKTIDGLRKNQKKHKNGSVELLRRIWNLEFKLEYKSKPMDCDKDSLSTHSGYKMDVESDVNDDKWQIDKVKHALSNLNVTCEGPTKSEVIAFLKNNASVEFQKEWNMYNGSPRVLRRSLCTKNVIKAYENYVCGEKCIPRDLKESEGLGKVMPILQLIDAFKKYVVVGECDTFVSRKITQKVVKQLHDPLTLTTSSLPNWCDMLVYDYGWLFGVDLRRIYLYSYGFDPSRSLFWVQNQRDALNARTRRAMQSNGLRNDEVRDEIRLGRIKIDRITIPRHEDSIFEWGRKIMRYHANLKSLLEILFENEDGTGTGPSLEFYNILALQFQKASLSMWKCSEEDGVDGEYVYSQNGIFPLALDQTGESCEIAQENFSYLGTLMGKTILDSRLLPLPLSRLIFSCFCNHVSKIHVEDSLIIQIPILRKVTRTWFSKCWSFDDLLSVDRRRIEFIKDLADRLLFYQEFKSVGNCEELEKMNDFLSDLCLTFEVAIDGNEHKTYKLVPDGGNLDVTFENLEHFLTLFYDFYFNRGIEKQMNALKDGFQKVVHMDKLTIFSVNELKSLICGQLEPTWTRQELVDYIEPKNGYSRDSDMFTYFINVLMELNTAERKKFLRFATGSSSLPAGGIKNFKPRITVVKIINSDDRKLPSVSTCIHFLKFPEYSSQQVLKSRLLEAICEVGFYLN